MKTIINENLKAEGAKINHDIIFFIAVMHHKSSKKGATSENLYLLLFMSVFATKQNKKTTMEKHRNYLGEMTAAADSVPSWTVALSATIMTDRLPTAPDIRIG